MCFKITADRPKAIYCVDSTVGFGTHNSVFELKCDVCFSVLFSYVLLELVETERDYVRDLGAVVEVGISSVLLI